MILMETVAFAVAPEAGRNEAAFSATGGDADAEAIEAMKRASEPTMKHVIPCYADYG